MSSDEKNSQIALDKITVRTYSYFRFTGARFR